MKHKRVLSTLTALSAAFCLSVTSVFADTDPDSVVEDIKGKKSAAEAQVSSLQGQLAELLIKISDLEEELVAKGEQVIRSKKDLDAAEKKERKQYADMKLRIKYLYELGDEPVLAMILNADSMSDMLSKAEYSEKVHRYDRDMLNEYSDSVQKVRDLKTSLEKEIEDLEGKQKEFEAHKAEFDEAIEAKKAEVEDLDAQLAEAIRIAEEARRKKEEEERRRREEEERRAQAAAAAAEHQHRESYGDLNAAEIIVQAAWSQIGVPYVWGGNTPYVGLDCSGLTKWCHAQAGIDIPRYSNDQRWGGGTVVYDPLPGDICWTPGHVAIYIGNGQMIEAQQSGTNICVSPVRVTNYVRWW